MRETSILARRSPKPGSTEEVKRWIVNALKALGPCTDDELLAEYRAFRPYVPTSESSLRTRRKELEKEGKVVTTLLRRPTSRGRLAEVWRANV